MKKSCIYTTLLFFALVSVDYVYAQDQKIGFFDSDVVLNQMPEYSGIEQQLRVLSENWQQEIRMMENELDELQRDFEAREILFTDEIRQQRLDEISSKQGELDRFTEEKFGPEGEYFTRQSELLEPIQRRIFDALDRVANRQNFDFVFDRAGETKFLFTREEWNLTDEVLLALGLDPAGN